MRALLVLVLLLVPGATASLAQLSVSSIEASGEATIAGRFVNLRSPEPGAAAQAAVESFTITAPSVRAEIDEMRTNLSVAGVGLTPRSFQRTPHDLTEVQLHSGRPQAETYLFVTPGPLAHAAVTASSLRIAPGREHGSEYAWVEMERERPVVEAAGTQAVQGTYTLRLEGSFRVSVWGWGLHIDSAEGTQAWQTGTERRDLSAGIVEEIVDRQTYLFVEDGVMEAQVTHQAHVLLQDTTAVVHGRAVLRGAEGSLELEEGAMNIHDAELILQGRSIIRAGASTAASIPVTIDGDAAATLDGRAITFADPTTHLWLLTLVPLLALALLYRYRPAAAVRRVEKALFAGNPARAERLCRRLLRRRRTAGPAKTLHTVTLLRLGRAADALHELQAAPDNDPVVSYMRARARAQLRDMEGAKRDLDVCLRLDPRFREEASLDPVLRRLLRLHHAGEFV